MSVVEVEVDIFSGMPNPAWLLTDSDAAAFLSEFGKLHETEAKTRSGRLGYRGLIVRIRQGLTREIYIQHGVAELHDAKTTRFFLDGNRSLERWLLGTGTLSHDLLKVIRAELNK